MTARTPTKTSVYNPDSYCKVCNENIRIKGVGKFNIFFSDRKLAQRLSQILQIEICPVKTLSNNVCITCFRKVEKIEKALKIVRDEIPQLKRQYLETELSQTEHADREQGRQKREGVNGVNCLAYKDVFWLS